MKISKLTIAIGILIVCITGIFAVKILTNEDSWICTDDGWQKHGNPTAVMPSAGCGNPTKMNINFTKSGYISDREISKANEGMYLIYEEPGKPALSAKLKFDERSACEIATEKVACISISSTIEKITENRLVEIKGFEFGNIVIVESLKINE